MKLFLLEWLALIFFWSSAFFFCFVGSQVLLKNLFRRLIIGTPFFLAFVFVVLAFGVPRYFVYDHVNPKTIDGIPYYPAVKNHLIFQGPSFKTYGVISRDLSDFKANEEYFAAFQQKPIEDYPSVSGLKSWNNEIALIALFIFWYFVLNKVHNASSATTLYKEAVEQPRIDTYESYLIASKPIRFLQPFKRKRAQKEIRRISEAYIQASKLLLSKLLLRADKQSESSLLNLLNQIGPTSSLRPIVKVNVNLEDRTSEEDKTLLEEGADYGPDYFKPKENELQTAFNQCLVKTLNQFLPEPFFTDGDESKVAGLLFECHFICFTFGRRQTAAKKKNYVRVGFANDPQAQSSKNDFFLRKAIEINPPKWFDNKQEDSRKYAATKGAQQALNDTLFGETTTLNPSKKEMETLKNKLEATKSIKDEVFDTILKETRSAARDLAISEAIKIAIENNQAEFDSMISDIHELLANSADIYVGLIAQEAAGALLEGAAGLVSD